MRPRKLSSRGIVLISAVVHALAVGLILIGLHDEDREPTKRAAIDIRLYSVEQPSTEANILPITITIPPPSMRSTLPKVSAVPERLPAHILARIRSQPTRPVGGEVVEISMAVEPVTATPSPVAAPGLAAIIPAGAGKSNGKPIHGTLDRDQAIVYVLDSSGSMGEWGKFDRAREALIATLRLQPANARFQIVVYAGTARLLLPDRGGFLTPTPELMAKVVETLSHLEPAGRSNHIAGARLGCELQPQIILLLTDGDDLPSAQLRAICTNPKPIKLCIAPCSATGIAQPMMIK